MQEPPRRTKGRRKAKDDAIVSESADIVVKSIADSKGKDRFYTAIRLPRQLENGGAKFDHGSGGIDPLRAA